MNSYATVYVGPNPPPKVDEYALWLSTALVDLTVSPAPGDRFAAITPTLSWESTAVQEPSVWFANGLWNMLYTGGPGAGGGTAYIGYASAPSPYGPWTKAGTQVIGGGQGGYASGVAHGSMYREGDTLYYIGVKLPTNVFGMWSASVSAPTVWTFVADILGLPSTTTQMGNCYLIKEGSSYTLFFEALYQSQWQSGYATCDTISGAYAVASFPTPSLWPQGNLATGSGQSVVVENGQYVGFFHSGPQNNNDVPTEGYRATSYDKVNWSIDLGGLPYIRRMAAQEIDQVADLEPAQDDKGNWWMFWSAASNHDSQFRVMASPMLPTLKRWGGNAWYPALAMPSPAGGPDYNYPPVFKTVAYTALNRDDVPVNAAGGAITITLPAANIGAFVRVHNVSPSGTNTVTVSAGAGDAVIGTNAALGVGTSATYRCYIAGCWSR